MKTVIRTVLVADEAMVLTNGKTYGKRISLAEGADPAAYREITAEEHAALMAESEGET